MPCCQIPNPAAPVFPPTLIPDAERFARYVGGATLATIGTIAPLTVITSALHLEMKLWNTGNQLPRQYLQNGAEHNSWIAMRARGRNTFSQAEKGIIFAGLNPGTPAPKQCVLTAYDDWLLTTILGLRTQGRNPGRNPELRTGYAPSTLSTVGSCQKLLNVFLKYELCWQVAGQWVGGGFFRYAPPRSPNLSQYLCALHAPIDSFLLKAIVTLPLGSHLVAKGLLRERDGYLRQSINSAFRPWSKLDCLRTYYGLQLMLRRIAMNTWPQSCVCNGSAADAIGRCDDWFNETYGGPECKGPDWVSEAFNLPNVVIENTIRKLAGGDQGETSALQSENEPRFSTPPVIGYSHK